MRDSKNQLLTLQLGHAYQEIKTKYIVKFGPDLSHPKASSRGNSVAYDPYKGHINLSTTDVEFNAPLTPTPRILLVHEICIGGPTSDEETLILC